MQINEVLKRPEYQTILGAPIFRSHPIMFLTFGGSYSYGTNVEGSDIDIRGVAMNSPSDLIGMSNFEQFLHEPTDTTIYGFKKFFQLALNCNPNVVEIAFCKPDTYAMVSPAGRLLLDNASVFLSQRAINSFGGYANQQLARLKNAVARDRMPQAEQEKHILDACNRTLRHMNERYAALPEGAIRLYVDETAKTGMDLEIFADIHLEHYPLRDFAAVYRDLNDTSKNYSHLQHRNQKKDDAHLNKHMMHLIRLYCAVCEILETGTLSTFRDKEHELLMSIRRGDYMDENGLVAPEFYEMLDKHQKRFEYAKAHTDLPKHPDMRRAEELCMEINRMAIGGNSSSLL